jgi:hypothetical protein
VRYGRSGADVRAGPGAPVEQRTDRSEPAATVPVAGRRDRHGAHAAVQQPICRAPAQQPRQGCADHHEGRHAPQSRRERGPRPRTSPALPWARLPSTAPSRNPLPPPPWHARRSRTAHRAHDADRRRPPPANHLQPPRGPPRARARPRSVASRRIPRRSSSANRVPRQARGHAPGAWAIRSSLWIACRTEAGPGVRRDGRVECARLRVDLRSADRSAVQQHALGELEPGGPRRTP